MLITRKVVGFTLIEVLISLAVFGILLVLGLSAFSVYQKNHRDLVCKDIKSGIYYAKTRAFQTGVPATLAPLDETGDWSLGMQLKQNDAVIYRWHWGYKDTKVAWQGFRAQDFIIFSKNLKFAAANGHFLISSPNGSKTKITLNRLGHIYTHSN